MKLNVRLNTAVLLAGGSILMFGCIGDYHDVGKIAVKGELMINGVSHQVDVTRTYSNLDSFEGLDTKSKIENMSKDLNIASIDALSRGDSCPGFCFYSDELTFTIRSSALSLSGAPLDTGSLAEVLKINDAEAPADFFEYSFKNETNAYHFSELIGDRGWQETFVGENTLTVSFKSGGIEARNLQFTISDLKS